MGKALPQSKAQIKAQKKTAGGQVNRFSRLRIDRISLLRMLKHGLSGQECGKSNEIEGYRSHRSLWAGMM
jgi:hypothetical protein